MEERVWEGILCEAVVISQGIVDFEAFDIVRYTGKSADFAVMENEQIKPITELERAKYMLVEGHGVLVDGEVLYMKGVTSMEKYNFIHAQKSLEDGLNYREKMLYESLLDKYVYLAVKSRLELFEIGVFSDEDIRFYLKGHVANESIQRILDTWTKQKVAV